MSLVWNCPSVCFCLFFLTLTSVRNSDQLFCRMLCFSEISLWLDSSYAFWREYYNSDVVSSLCRIRRHVIKVKSLGFSTIKLLFPFFFFSLSNYYGVCEEMLWDYINTLFLSKILPTGFSIHWWFLLTIFLL